MHASSLEIKSCDNGRILLFDPERMTIERERERERERVDSR
jgi:hypothetical protein